MTSSSYIGKAIKVTFTVAKLLVLGKHKRSNAQLNGLKTGNEWENMKVELPRPKHSNVQCCLQHGMHLYQLSNKQIYS